MSLWPEYKDHWKTFDPRIRRFLFAVFFYQLALVVFNLFYNLYLLELGFREDFLGVINGLYPLAAGLIALPGGILSDRFGRQRAISLAFSLSILTILGRVYLVSVPVVYGLFFLDGLGFGLYAVAQGPFVFENSQPEERISVFTFLFLAALLPGIIGNLLGGYLPHVVRLLAPGLTRANIFRVVLTASPLFLLAAVAVLTRIEEAGPPPQAGASLTISLAPGEWSVVGKFLITTALISFGASHFLPFMNAFFSRALQATPAQIGVIFSLSQATVALASLSAPFLAEKMGKIRAIVFFQSFAVPLLFTMAWAPNLAITAVAFALRNAFMQMVGPIKNPLALSLVTQENRGKVNGILNLVNSLAQSGGSFSAGYIIHYIGYGPSFSVAAVTYFISTVLFWLFFRHLDRNDSSDSGPKGRPLPT